MFKAIGTAAMVLALATSGSAMLGGTALASSAPDGVDTTAPCMFTIYFWGFKWVIPAPCPADASNGGTATNN
jgi:hypothetical protein